MPISLVDLPGIRTAIRDLYKAIDTPPSASWVPPAWLDGLPKYEKPNENCKTTELSHARLVHLAGLWVRSRLSTAREQDGYFLGVNDDRRDITGSDLSLQQKKALLELANHLESLDADQVVAHATETIWWKDFLLKTLKRLGKSPPSRPTGMAEGAPSIPAMPAGNADITSPALPEVAPMHSVSVGPDATAPAEAKTDVLAAEAARTATGRSSESAGTQGHPTTSVPADAAPLAHLQQSGAGKPIAEPRKLLTGWQEITHALKMQFDDRKKIKSMNERYEGPIENGGPGTRPMVYLDALIEWWNTLAILQQELANRRQGAKASAEAQHNYGRDGVVGPEIGGEVKKRRRRGPT